MKHAFVLGIIDTPFQSLFTYGEGKSWEDYYDPNYKPTYDITFSDPKIEAAAIANCKGDKFCLFDIAATGNIDVGMSTLQGSEDYETILQNSVPGTTMDHNYYMPL